MTLFSKVYCVALTPNPFFALAIGFEKNSLFAFEKLIIGPFQWANLRELPAISDT